mmetsp:Transcript_26176/g.38773  ORF Transcript_26176/g.38773 Transcript_26176/m.38773 type:complete len:204 (-) Transcript_26176:373-984(-)
MRQVCLSSVLLPPIFGPLNKRIFAPSSSTSTSPIDKSFGMKSPPLCVNSTHGCLPWTMFMPGPTFEGHVLMSGRVYPAFDDACASDPKASIIAEAWAAEAHNDLMESNFANISCIPRAFPAFMTSYASSRSSTSLSTTGVEYLLTCFAPLPRFPLTIKSFGTCTLTESSMRYLSFESTLIFAYFHSRFATWLGFKTPEHISFL